MILGCLILAHLMGDFVFQTTKLVEMKKKGTRGILIHSAIHFILTFLILLPFYHEIPLILPAVSFGTAFLHFWIDHAKISYEFHHKETRQIPFFIDQLFHAITLILAYFILSNAILIIPGGLFYKIYTNESLILFLIILIFIHNALKLNKFKELKSKNKPYSKFLTLTLVYLFFIFLTLQFST